MTAAALAEVEAALAAAAIGIPPDVAEARRRYCGSLRPALGLPVPVQRRLFRAGYRFMAAPFAEQLAIWDHVWRQARTHEARGQALLFTETWSATQRLAAWPTLQA